MKWPFADPRDGGRNIIATIQVPIRRPNHTARRARSPEAHRRGGARRAGAHAATLSLHSTALRRDHAAWRIGLRQFGGLAVHAVAGRGRDSAGRHARRPQGPRRPVRPRSGRALQAQTANDRTPVCGQNPKEPRRRAAGAPGTPNRRIGAPPPRARRRKARPARPASGPRRGADPARGFPDTDRRRRIMRARMSNRDPPSGRSMIRARPRPLHRFGSQPIEPPAVN